MKFPQAIAVGFCLVALAGCGPSSPLDRTIDAETPSALSVWYRRQARAFSPVDLKRLAKAEKELQLFTVTEWQGLPPHEQRLKWRQHVIGVRVRQFIIQGHQFANLRLEQLLEDQRRLLQMHDEVVERANTDLDGYGRLQHTMQRISEQIAALTAEIAENETVIRELSPAPPVARPKAVH